MVDGEVVFEQGALTRMDGAEYSKKRETCFAEDTQTFSRFRREAADLLPYYQAVVKKAATADLGMNRWVGGR